MGELLVTKSGGSDMKSRLAKKAAGAALAVVFLLGVGMVAGTTAQAQDRGRWDRSQRSDRVERQDRDGDRNRSDWNRRQQIERAREIERARQLAWQRERERERLRSRNVYVYPRTYPNGGSYGGTYGGYGNYGGYRGGSYGGGNSYEVEKGFRDGLDRGQEDARDRRSPNPNNSSHYRSGDGAYREGFRRGYEQGYRQYGGGRRW